jgi:type IV secretory pathway VirJ component
MPSSQARTFASALLPRTLSPLSFAATAGETEEYADVITAIMEGAASTLARELGAKLAEDFSPAAKYLRDNSLSKLTGDLAPVSVERLQDALATAWDEGGDMQSMVAAVRETFEDFSETRAELIASTEGNDAYNVGRDETARALGMDEKFWETESGDPCAVCIANEGDGWIDIDDEFSSGDKQPTAHPNCACSTNYRISGNGAS